MEKHHRATGRTIVCRLVVLSMAVLPFIECSEFDGGAPAPESSGIKEREGSAAEGAVASGGRDASSERFGGASGGGATGSSGAAARDGSAGRGGAIEAGADASPRVDSGSTKDALRAATVRLNELNANISKGCDLVELRVLSAGTMQGFELWARTTPLIAFSDFTVKSGDIVVVHLNSAECSPGEKNETISPAQNSEPAAYAAAFDWYSTTEGLVSTDLVLTLYDANGVMLDAALFSDDPAGTAAASSEEQASTVASAGHWEMIGGGVPAGGFVDENFNAHAVQDLNATSTAAEGTSISRKNDVDSNQKTDWSEGVSTWGSLNAGQSSGN